MTLLTDDQVHAIVNDIQERLNTKKLFRGVALHVPEGGYRQDDDWLVVVVAPEKPGIRAYDYVEVLGEVERELKESGVRNVILVPEMAD
jgi:hypothetical protein